MALRLLSVLLLVLCVCARQNWDPQHYPNPTKDVQLCGRRGVQSWICDPDALLSYNSANFVEGTIKKIAAAEPPYVSVQCGGAGSYGYQVAVALMKEFDVPLGRTPEYQAEAFARSLHDSWGVGLRECSNGVLLLLSANNRQVYISTGSAAAEKLTDRVLDIIIDNMKPALREAKYGDAVEKAVVEIGLALAGQRVQPDAHEHESGWTPLVIILGFLGGVFSLFTWLTRRNQRQYKAATTLLERLKADQKAAMEGKYVAKSCPICLEDFSAPQGNGAPAGSQELRAVAEEASDELSGPSAPLLPQQSAAATSSSTPGGSASASGGEGSTPARRKPGTGDQPSRKPLVLLCGHGFCETCIAEWLKTKTNCPICRKSITPDGAAPQPPRPSVHPGQRYQTYDVAPELAFRLHSLRRRYPSYVTSGMVSSWEQDLMQGRELNATAMRDFQLRDPAMRHATQHSGSHGSSSSFGGGHSSGGRGGSW